MAKFMKLTSFSFLFVIIFALTTSAQKPDEVLATATAHSFTVRDLPAETQQAISQLPSKLRSTRLAILEQMVNMRLLEIEAKALGISSGKLLANEKAKVPNPTDAEIKSVYDANRSVLGDLTLEQAKKQIVAYIRSTPEQKALGALFVRLKNKYKYAAGKDINLDTLAPADVVARYGTVSITAKEFEDFARVALYELRASLSDIILEDLNDTIYAYLLIDEAKAAKTDAGDLIAKEITNKMKEFSDEERFGLESAFREKLFAKYKASITYTPPEPIVQNISTDDDPATGPADAPVTVIMFSDFQCSACSATHPILKRVMAEFPGKIRFVVRDFPLESIHENGFSAALAAGAANAQGKFFEYIEILYKHQDALDAPSLKKYAGELGLNVKQFEIDFTSEKIAAEVRKDMDDGDDYVINSTPTIFVNGVRIRNISPVGIKAAIDKALAKTK